MNRTGALSLLLLVTLLLGYGVVELFRGNFGVMFASMPVLLLSWFFLVSRRNR